MSCVVGNNLYGGGSAPDGGALYYISNGDIEVLRHTIDTNFMLSIWYILQAHPKKTDGFNIACNGSDINLITLIRCGIHTIANATSLRG